MYDVNSKHADDFINHEEILETLRYAEENKHNEALIAQILEKAKKRKGLEHREAMVLLDCDIEEKNQEIYALAEQIKKDFYGNRIVMFAPLYLSNYCVNGCVYCPYHAKNKHISRKKLTQEEIRKEVIALQDMGHKRLALETGEDPVNNPIEYVLESIKTIYSIKHKNGAIRRVNVNIAATTVENYRKLKEAGIGTYILFQETYHKESYEKLHPTGPKHNYAYHTEAMDRAMEGGIDDVGLGVLFGLERYRYELATMGCRTRVFENVAGEKSSLGRGNLSFTTLNMPRLAIEARIKAENMTEDGHNKDAVERKAKEIFIESIHETATLIAEQLYERYQYQRTALARQFPFMMGNDVWKGGAALNPNEQVGDVLRSGTLGIGFLGGHNAMVALYGEGHGHSQKAWDTLYEAVLEINKVADEYKAKYNLNYSVLATPAEGLSGRFTRMDRRKYGKIKGVTDNDYYVNSFHVDVKEPISIVEKIKCEAPFHAITRGGHITYVELDGEAQKNVRAIAKIVKVMHDEGIGYGSINHPVDTCHNCGYKGVIFDKCPVCQSESILRMRRITGYLTGDLSSWNSAKRAEEKDRVKHL